MVEMADFTRVRPETLDMLRQRADAEQMSVDSLLELAIVAYDRRKTSAPASPSSRIDAPFLTPPSPLLSTADAEGKVDAPFLTPPAASVPAAKPVVKPPVAKPAAQVGSKGNPDRKVGVSITRQIAPKPDASAGRDPKSRTSTPEFIDFVAAQADAVRLDGKPSEFFLHAGIIGVFVNGVRAEMADSWGTTTQLMCDEVARRYHIHGADLAQFLKTNVEYFRIVAGHNKGNGYKYNPKQNVSVQVMSTARCATSAFKMAELSKVDLTIFTRWRMTAGPSLRGRVGMLGVPLKG